MVSSSSVKGTAAALKAFYAALKLAKEEGIKTCSVPSIVRYGQPYSNLGGYTFHQVITITSAISTILCCIICGAVVIGHLHFYVKPQEQKQLLRVIFTLPIFAVCGFFGCWFYNVAPYLKPIPQVFEAFGIVALFYFYINSVTPNETCREEFYDGLERQKAFHREAKHGNGSLRWFHLIWISVFQVCLGRIGTTILFEYFEATICPLDPRLQRRTTIITIIESIQTTIAVIAVILYERRMRGYLQGQRPLAKLITFKAILLIEAFQILIFEILAYPKVGAFTPSYHMSYYDFTMGIPAFMLCCELFFFSVSFWWSFSYSPYRALAREGHPRLGVWRGLWDVINIMDIIHGIIYLFKALLPSNFGKKYVQRRSDATLVTEEQITKSHITPMHNGSESEPDTLQSGLAPVHLNEKV